MSNRENDELLYALGEAIGYALAPLIKGLQDGASDRAVNEAAAAVEREAADPEEDDRKADEMVQEQYAICHNCACAYCADLENCKDADCPVRYGGVIEELCKGRDFCSNDNRIATEHCNVG